MPSTGTPRTPQSAAAAWVDSVMDDGDLAGAWPRTDPILRLVLAQDWIWRHRDDTAIGTESGRDDLAAALSAAHPVHRLWARFAEEAVATWHRAWRGFDTRTWTVSPQPEVLDLDVELVTFTEPGAHLRRQFAMRHTDDGWLVAGVNGETLFEPGWPPTCPRTPS